MGDDPEATALMVVACSRAFAVGGWRVVGSVAEWTALFEEGCRAAERAGDLAALAILNTNYSAVRGLGQGIAGDYVRYASEAVQIAERTGNAALRCGTLGYLTCAYAWNGLLPDAQRVAEQVIALAGADAHLGAAVAGFSPLPAARFIRAHSIGFARDPATALRELPVVRQVALDSGLPEQALWTVFEEAELRCAVGSSDGTRALAQAAARLAENLEAGGEIAARVALSAALACEREWHSLLDTAGGALRLIRERGALRLWEPDFLAHIGTAQLELGNLDAGRVAAAEGVAFMREAQGWWKPNCYAVLARAQLALSEPAADVAHTLDEYAALLERTAFHPYEGELHELRARLAEREGQHSEKVVALQRACDCYIRFDMTAQATRVAKEIG